MAGKQQPPTSNGVALLSTSEQKAEQKRVAAEAALVTQANNVAVIQALAKSSGAVLKALQQIKSEQEAARDAALRTETAAKRNFDHLKQSLDAAIRNYQDQMAGIKQRLAASLQASSASQADLEQAVATRAATTEYLETVTSQCKQKALEWKDRTKLRADEITAVTEAWKILANFVETMKEKKRRGRELQRLLDVHFGSRPVKTKKSSAAAGSSASASSFAQEDSATSLQLLSAAEQDVKNARKNAPALPPSSSHADVLGSPADVGVAVGLLSFLQTSTSARAAAEAAATRREKNLDAAESLREILESSGSSVLALLSQRVQARLASGQGLDQPDPFKDVKQMIQEMVAKLMEEAAKAADRKKYCDAELAKSTGQKDKKAKKADRLAERVEGFEANQMELGADIQALTREIEAMERMVTEAADIREKEKAENGEAIREFQDSQNLIQSAITVLKEFYAKKQRGRRSSSSFAQGAADSEDDGDSSSSAPPPKTWGGGGYGAKQGGADAVFGLLEIAIADYARLEAETGNAEATSQREFDKLMKESAIKKAVSAKDLEYKKQEQTKLTTHISRAKGDLADTKKELEAATVYLEKLQEDCGPGKADSFEEREARRQRQIESLQNALSVLAGEAVAA